MALKSGNLRRSLRHTDSGSIDETIIESEQTLDYTHDGDFNYLQAGESTFISASGTSTSDGIASLGYLVLGISATGSASSTGTGVLDFTVISISASGSSTSTGTGDLVFNIEISGTGTGEGISPFSDLSFLIDVSGDGSGEGVGEKALLGYIYTVSSFATGLGTGISSLGIVLEVTSDVGVGEGTGVKGFLQSAPFDLIASGSGEGVSAKSDLGIESLTNDQKSKREESYFVGDIEIPLLISRDMSVGRNTEDKHFVNADSQFFQESSNYESGNFTAVLNEEEHSKGKTLEQQTDDLRKLLDRLPQENEIDYVDGTAYLAVQGINDVIDVDQNVREVEFDAILLEEV